MPGSPAATNLAGAHERLDVHAAQHIIIIIIIIIKFKIAKVEILVRFAVVVVVVNLHLGEKKKKTRAVVSRPEVMAPLLRTWPSRTMASMSRLSSASSNMSSSGAAIAPGLPGCGPDLARSRSSSLFFQCRPVLLFSVAAKL